MVSCDRCKAEIKFDDELAYLLEGNLRVDPYDLIIIFSGSGEKTKLNLGHFCRKCAEVLRLNLIKDTQFFKNYKGVDDLLPGTSEFPNKSLDTP